VAAVVVAVLFFGIGTQSTALLQAERVDPDILAQNAGEAGPPDGAPSASEASSREGTAPVPAEKARVAAEGTTEDVLASHNQYSTTHKDARDENAREEAQRAEQEAAEQQLEEASDEPLDVLVLGVDKRPDSAEGESTRSDTMMLVRVTPATGRIKLLSVPRDLYVEIEPGVRDKINSAYAYGGVEGARTVMEDLTGVEVDNYVVADFEGFEEVIDIIGGVKVDVGHGVFPEKWRMGEGVQRLGGRKALFYARYRGTPGGDLDRMEHQRELVAALRSKALRWNAVKKVPATMELMNENVETDLGLDGAIALGQVLIRKGRHAEMTSEQLEGTPKTLRNGDQVLVPDDEANKAILQEFRY
jgi:polyisoprenyl-teichoic acid--peptidoglycan teichoic acid transferase